VLRAAERVAEQRLRARPVCAKRHRRAKTHPHNNRGGFEPIQRDGIRRRVGRASGRLPGWAS